MLRSLADWWDSVELWITQLSFPFQVLLAIVILLPLCGGLAVLADRATEAVNARLDRRRLPGGSRPRG